MYVLYKLLKILWKPFLLHKNGLRAWIVQIRTFIRLWIDFRVVFTRCFWPDKIQKIQKRPTFKDKHTHILNMNMIKAFLGLFCILHDLSPISLCFVKSFSFHFHFNYKLCLINLLSWLVYVSNLLKTFAFVFSFLY